MFFKSNEIMCFKKESKNVIIYKNNLLYYIFKIPSVLYIYIQKKQLEVTYIDLFNGNIEMPQSLL